MATNTAAAEVKAHPENGLKGDDQSQNSIRDWPNDAGFQALHEQLVPVELRTTGSIPAYAAGTLYRTGPGSYIVDRGQKDDFICSHWFDGFGHTHRFNIVPEADGSTKVWYNSRGSSHKLVETIKKTGQYRAVTFGQKLDPCIGIFGKVMSVFDTGSANFDPSSVNLCVTLRANMPGLPSSSMKDSQKPGHSTGLKNLWNFSDLARMKNLDPLTLEPIGLAHQKSLHPLLSGPLSSAHAMSDPTTGDVFNYNLTVGAQIAYRVFKVSAETGKTEILATLSGHGIKLAYLHSFFMTEDFIILCIWNARLQNLKLIKEQNIMDAISPFDPSQPTKWFVVDRKHGRGLVAEFESPASFCFHSVNAWQEVDSEGKLNIMCDYIEYENLDILHALYYSNMTSSSKDAVTFNNEKGLTSTGRLCRYKLSNISSKTLVRGKKSQVSQAELIFAFQKREGGDLPTINPNFAMKKNRYAYGIVNRGYSSFFDGISKVDMDTKKVIFWENPKGHTPGEAIFVPNPEGTEEDDGVLLSVVLDGPRGISYLICLDARTLTEVGRAECDWAVGLGFHGAHISGAVSPQMVQEDSPSKL